MQESGSSRTALGVFLDLAATDPGLPTYRRLFLALRNAILQQRIASGTRLPATRVLASELKIARNTIKTAYELLQAEGYLQVRAGSGHYVQALPARASSATETDVQAGVTTPAPARTLLLQTARPALDRFPRQQWQQCLQQACGLEGLGNNELQGALMLRQQIARWLNSQRGMTVNAEQILITSGSQQGLYLLARQLLRPGDQVLLEAPGFAGITDAMQAAGAKTLHRHQHELQQSANLPDARLLVLTPSRNFPLGHTLPAPARLALLHWAQSQRCWLVEDDYDSEFSAGPAHTALFSLDGAGRTIYAGTFSRTLFPGLRLGYLVLPPTLVGAFVKARRVIDGGLSSLPQLALARFMADGHYDRHLRRMRRLYAQRRRSLETLLATSALAKLPLIDAGGGMHLVLGLPTGCDDRALSSQLNAAGIGSRALRHYDPAGEPGLVLGFSGDDEAAQQRALAILQPRVLSALEALNAGG